MPRILEKTTAFKPWMNPWTSKPGEVKLHWHRKFNSEEFSVSPNKLHPSRMFLNLTFLRAIRNCNFLRFQGMKIVLAFYAIFKCSKT